MTWPALAALLSCLAALTTWRSVRRPSLRPAAVALGVLAVADVVRLVTHDAVARLAASGAHDTPLQRLDVALSLLWPTAAAWLIGGMGPLAVGVAYAAALALGWHRLAGGMGWGAELEVARWQAALQLPRYAVGALATVEALRRRVWQDERGADGAASGPKPWTASQRVGLWLAAGQVVMVAGDALERAAGVSGIWSRWQVVRAVSAVFYGLCALVVLGEPRPR